MVNQHGALRNDHEEKKLVLETSVYSSFNYLMRLLVQGYFINICKYTLVTRRLKYLIWK